MTGHEPLTPPSAPSADWEDFYAFAGNVRIHRPTGRLWRQGMEVRLDDLNQMLRAALSVRLAEIKAETGLSNG